MERKVQIIIVLTISICLIAAEAVCYISIKRVVIDNYTQLSLQYTEQLDKNIEQHMRLIEESVKLVSDNQRIMDALKDPLFDTSIIPILDGLLLSNLNIKGATVYSDNGSAYMSSNISNIPPLDWLKIHEFPHTFLNSAQSSLWLVRYKGLEGFYSSQYYNRSRGILSYILKINDDRGNLLGFLLVDTEINALYNFFRNTDDAFFKYSGAYITVNDGDILPSPFGAIDNPSVTEHLEILRRSKSDYMTWNDSKKQNVLLYDELPNSNADILLVISLDSIYARFHYMFAILLMLLLLFCLLSILMGRILAKSISIPLDNLYDKMHDFS